MSAVAHGLMAIGIGDGRSARRSANEARRLIGDEPLTLLLRAQAAQLTGDRPEAEAAFRAMLDQPETRPLGYRGLFVEARRRGDDREALRLADRAVEANPDVPWAGPALLDLQSNAGDWDGALRAVERNLANRVTSKAEAKDQRAVLLTAKALDLEENRPDEAREVAAEAAKLAPGSRSGGGDRRAACSPRAAICARPPAFSKRRGSSPASRYRRGLCASALRRCGRRPPEAGTPARRARAGRSGRCACPRAGGDGCARVRDRPPGSGALRRARTDAADCLLMAEIENAEHGDRGRSRAWLARAGIAARDPAWVADGVVSDTWRPVSPNGRLGAFEWKVPMESLAAPDSALLEAEVVATEAELPALAPVLEAPDPGPNRRRPSPLRHPRRPRSRRLPRRPSRSLRLGPRPANLRPRRVAPVEVVLPSARPPDDPGPDDYDEPTPRNGGRPPVHEI